MPTYVITAPDGKEYEVSAPEGASQAQVLEYAKANYQSTPKEAPSEQAPEQTKKPSILDALGRGAGMAGRAVGTGAAGLASVGLDAAAGSFNIVSNLFGSELRAPYVSQEIQKEMNRAGLATPETVPEKALSGGVAAMTGAGLMNAASSVSPALSAALGVRTAPALASTVVGGATAPVAADAIKEVTGSNLAATAGALGLSVLFGALAGGGVQALQNSSARKQLLSMDEIRQRAKTNYDTLDSSGVTLKPQWVNAIIGSAERSLAKNERYDPALNPQVAATFKAMRDSVAANGAAPVSFMEELRKRAQDLKASPDPRTQALGGALIRELDGYFTSLPQAALNTGSVKDLKQVTEALSSARKDWRNLSRAETIEELMRKADITSDRPTSAQAEQLRQQLIIFQKNPNNLKMFTKDEQDAIRAISKDGLAAKTTAIVAGFSPNRAGLQASGAKGGLITAALTGQPQAAAGITALMGAGWTADKIIELTKNAAGRRLIQDLANGTVKPPPPGTMPNGLFGGALSVPLGLNEERQ